MKITFLILGGSQIGGISKYNQPLLLDLEEITPKMSVIRLQPGGFIGKFFFALKTILNLFFFKPDFIFCAHINFSPLVYFLKKIFNFNYVVIAYGIDVFDINSVLKLKALRSASKIIAISHFTAAQLKRQDDNLGNKIYILPPTIDSQKFFIKSKPDYLLKKHNLYGRKIILTVSRLIASEKYKGYDKVISSLPQVLKLIPNLSYLIVGAGDDEPRIEELIKKLNLQEHVILAGFAPDEELVDYYNLADLFVMPSEKEGFGIVFLEALACGKPVVAGSKDGSKDAVLNGELGILVNPDNTDEIAQAIIKVLKKEVSENILDSNYLRRRILEVYGFDKFKERVKSLIYELQG